jgi:hypothetical protein
VRVRVSQLRLSQPGSSRRGKKAIPPQCLLRVWLSENLSCFPPATTPLCGRNNEVGVLPFHCKKLFQHRGTASALVAFANQETTGAAMLGVLILSLSVIACGALPWWPYSASARSRYHRPWDWLIDSGSTTGAEKRAIRSRRDRRGGEAREAYETRHPAPTRRPTQHPSPAKVSTRPTAAAGAGRDILVA